MKTESKGAERVMLVKQKSVRTILPPREANEGVIASIFYRFIFKKFVIAKWELNLVILAFFTFIDLRTLGITNYSQMKVVVEDKNTLPEVRQKIEAMGYITNSVVDTVEQINNLFVTARTLLALVGAVALAIASLGMFNTLTVSLLERTREIGLMKALGMKSEEVKELFLTESMIMGIFSGVLGIVIGVLGGKLLGLFLSLFSLTKGLGYIDVAHVPLFFLVLVIVLSVVVGVVTGLYPSRRAKNISALNALRYE